MAKSMKIGGGGRFAKLAGQKGANLAAWLGRKRYGSEKMTEMAAAGRRRAAKNK
jgi:hypothetical protein